MHRIKEDLLLWGIQGQKTKNAGVQQLKYGGGSWEGYKSSANWRNSEDGVKARFTKASPNEGAGGELGHMD